MILKRLLGVLLAATILTGCAPAQETTDKLTIVTTFYPLYDFTKKLTEGVDVEVLNMMGSGATAHDYEPSVQDRLVLEDADIFVYNGAGMESWVDKTLSSMDTTTLDVVDSSKYVDVLEADEHHHHEDGEEDHEDHDYHEQDPHIWLDPLNAIQQAKAILESLITIDPENKATYEANYETLKASLEALDTTMVEGMKTVSNKTVVMNHSAFSYMAHRYGFTIESISGIIPDSEPSSQQITRVIEFINEHAVKTILMETTSNEKVVSMLTNEVKVNVLSMDTLESVANSETADYVNIMKSNIENLLTAMK